MKPVYYVVGACGLTFGVGFVLSELVGEHKPAESKEPRICSYYRPPLCKEDEFVWRLTKAGCYAPFCDLSAPGAASLENAPGAKKRP